MTGLHFKLLCSVFQHHWLIFFSLHLPSLIKMPHTSRMDPSHNPLQQQQQQQQQHQSLHGNSNMVGPGGPMHSRNSSQNPRMHTDSFGLGGPGGPGDVSEPALDVSRNQSSITDQSNDFCPWCQHFKFKVCLAQPPVPAGFTLCTPTTNS